MITRPRPYIPMAVRVQVAERQFCAKEAACGRRWSPGDRAEERSNKLQLALLLTALGGGAKMELDHDPALILREFKADRRRPMAAWYTPNANDPNFLLYRPEGAHQQKTTGRKPGAERTVTTKGSDIGLKAKFARLEKRTAKSRRPKAKIASRPFSSQKRSFR